MKCKRISDPLQNSERPLKTKNRSKEIDQNLWEGDGIYKTIWDNSLAGIYVVQNGKFRALNPIALSYTGYTQKELIGRKADYLIFPEDKKQVKINARAMLTGKRSSPYEFRIVTKKEEVRWVMETTASTFFEGKPAILGNSMDITERKLFEKRLQESENLYRVIFENTGTAALIVENDMTISLINSEFEKLTGYRIKDWEGKKKWTEYVVKEDLPRMKRYHRRRRVDPNSAPRNYEYRVIDSQGRIKNVFNTIAMIPGTKKSISSLTDITAWKETEKRLRLREEELENKSRNLRELNTALRVLLKQREDDRQELEEKVISNVKEFVLPYVEKIKNNKMTPGDSVYVDIMESNLREIISPFSRKLASKYKELTPKEIQIANFIKEGKTSKEMADILNVSKSAIDIHRYRLRNKLGLNNQKVNLRSHLITNL
ncbi:MAG TPA: PAS domain S-box protein [Thermodesulfobacteriota bacterium]|nr:PAS domain S-box protein [Thermodesulfobacteriota bacterium]